MVNFKSLIKLYNKIMKNYKNVQLIELIQLAQDKDEKALNEIIRRYNDKIYNTFLKLHPESDLADLTQDALTKIIKSIKNLKNPEKFDSWLYQIIQNLFYDSLRKKQNNKDISTINPIVDSKDENGNCLIDSKKTPDENSINCELNAKINKAINELPASFKTIIILREFDGLSYEQIAKLTNLNLNTVKSRIARARIKLKNELEPYIK